MTRDDGSIKALVLTHRRPGPAEALVRSLLHDEGFQPRDVLLVVNGWGGLRDQQLQRKIETLHLGENLGPAGGLRAGLQRLRDTTACEWIYVCEDDVPLSHLRIPRVRALVSDIERFETNRGFRVGAVVGWGLQLDRATGRTTAHIVSPSGPRFQRVDLSGWGATLLSRRVVDAGVLPDSDFFFGFEDWDFWLRMNQLGFELLLDTEALDPVLYGESRRFRRHEPLHGVAWRGYYQARNFFELRRRYGNPAWTRIHLGRCVRRIRQARTWSRRVAITMGVVDGLRRKLGKNTTFLGHREA